MGGSYAQSMDLPSTWHLKGRASSSKRLSEQVSKYIGDAYGEEHIPRAEISRKGKMASWG